MYALWAVENGTPTKLRTHEDRARLAARMVDHRAVALALDTGAVLAFGAETAPAHRVALRAAVEADARARGVWQPVELPAPAPLPKHVHTRRLTRLDAEEAEAAAEMEPEKRTPAKESRTVAFRAKPAAPKVAPAEITTRCPVPGCRTASGLSDERTPQELTLFCQKHRRDAYRWIERGHDVSVAVREVTTREAAIGSTCQTRGCTGAVIRYTAKLPEVLRPFCGHCRNRISVARWRGHKLESVTTAMRTTGATRVEPEAVAP